MSRLKPRPMPARPGWLRAGLLPSAAAKVDRQKEIIYGYNVAQLGPFQSEGRGEFNMESLRQIVTLMNKKTGGVKSHFTHPTLSSDGLGTLLGFARDARIDNDRVKADL